MRSISGSRVPLATLMVALVVILVVSVAWGPAAFGAHIPATGPLPANCVEFQAGTEGSETPPSYPAVTITLVDWGDLHDITFSVAGLGAGQYVDISVKSGTTVQEHGPYGNGTHTFDNSLQQAISHIRLCVFQGQVTTTTTDPTTTTTGPTTTTTTTSSTTTSVGQTTTTTTGGSTTTSVGQTTTTTDPTTTTTGVGTTSSTVADEVLPTVLTTSTTVTGQVDDTTVAGPLPFTGADSADLAQLSLGLLAFGAVVLAFAGRRTESEPIE